MAKKKPPINGLAKGVTGRWTAKGTISLQVTDPHTLNPETLKPKRVTPRAILPDEPSAYATLGEARKASYRLADAVQERKDRGITVAEFWDEWTDTDHWAWRIGSSGRERTPQTRKSYADRTRLFVQTFGERPMASIVKADVRSYMSQGKGTGSQVSALRAFFTDATRDAAGPIRSDNPFEEIATEKGRAERKKRKEEWVDAPTPEEIDRILARALATGPYSIYAWIYIGTETGMRCAEIDAMKLKHLDLSEMTYWVEEQFNHKLRSFTAPKYNSKREVVLPEAMEPVLRRLIFEANAIGSPYLLNSPKGQLRHWHRDARETYWSGKGREDGGLRALLSDPSLTLYESTRHYFTTQAVLGGAPIHFLAPHLGHSDKGETLMAYYARLNQTHRREAMRAYHANRPTRATQIRKVS